MGKIAASVLLKLIIKTDSSTLNDVFIYILWPYYFAVRLKFLPLPVFYAPAIRRMVEGH